MTLDNGRSLGRCSITHAYIIARSQAEARPATTPVTKGQESYSQAIVGDTIDIYRPYLSLNNYDNYELKGDSNIKGNESEFTM